MLLLLLACVPTNPRATDDDGPFHDGAPALTGLSWACDLDAETWTFAARTDAWTGNGYLWVGRDTVTTERHRIGSSKAAADGSYDCLELELAIVADWRDAVSGSSTRWRCSDAPDLSFELLFYDPRGEEAAGCAVWGANPALWEGSEDVPSCAEVVDFSLDSGEAGDELSGTTGELCQ